MWYSPSSIRSALARRLTPERKAWISKLRHGEHPWQETIRRATAGSAPTAVEYDARRAQADSLDIIRRRLDDRGVDFVELPRNGAFAPTLICGVDDTRRALTALTDLCRNADRDAEWKGSYCSVNGIALAPKTAEKNAGEVAAMRLLRRVFAPNGRELSTSDQTITVEFWERLGPGVPRADGGTHLPGTLRRRQPEHDLITDYIEPAVWDQAIRSSSVLRLPAPHLKVFDEPVDVVYTWVDGSDPLWHRRMVSARKDIDTNYTEPSSFDDSRFTSRDELKYSLRSLEYYASWARRIFIVTDDQVPAWLDTEHPRITVVDHRDIFADRSVLPVFNSHAIESQLHHIEGLGDRYLYLNDDCFFLRPTEPELFYTANGLAKHFPSVVPVDVGGWSPRDLPIISAAKQGRDFMIEKFGRTVTHRFQHTPHPQLRRELEAMEREEPGLFAQVAASKFRSPNDYSIPSSLHHFVCFAQGRSIEGAVGYQFVDLARDDLELQLGRVARSTELDVFCLNETALPEGCAAGVDRLVSEFLEDRFPVPSSFERSPDTADIDVTDERRGSGYSRRGSVLTEEKRRR